VTSCTPMTCAAGEYATLLGSTSLTEGCTKCARGYYSDGGVVDSCTPMNCALGEYATITGSTTLTEGCTVAQCGK